MHGRCVSGWEKQVEEEASLGKRMGVVGESCWGSGSCWGAWNSGERSRLRGTEVETGAREEMKALGGFVEEAGGGPQGGLISNVRREEEVSRWDC